MSFTAMFEGPWGPLIIFLLRGVDVTLATLRVILVVRHAKKIVPLIALCEMFLWVFAVGGVFQNLHSFWHILGFAAGFAAGNVAGIWLEEKLAIGYMTVTLVPKKKSEIAQKLRQEGFGVTEIPAQGRDGAVDMLMILTTRKQLPGLLQLARKLDPGILIATEAAHSIRGGWRFPQEK